MEQTFKFNEYTFGDWIKKTLGFKNPSVKNERVITETVKNVISSLGIDEYLELNKITLEVNENGYTNQIHLTLIKKQNCENKLFFDSLKWFDLDNLSKEISMSPNDYKHLKSFSFASYEFRVLTQNKFRLGKVAYKTTNEIISAVHSILELTDLENIFEIITANSNNGNDVNFTLNYIKSNQSKEERIKDFLKLQKVMSFEISDYPGYSL